MRFWILALASLCCACTVNPSREDRIRSEMQPFIGQPLTAYLQASGDTPDSMYNTADGRRHFVFERSRFVAVSGYSGTTTCKRTIETQPDGRSGTPDAFRIVSINSIGAC